MVDTGKEEPKLEDDLIGRTVKKLFIGFGYFTGKVVSFNCRSGYYRVAYDDGDREELELHELKEILADVNASSFESGKSASSSRKRFYKNDGAEACGGTEEQMQMPKQTHAGNKKSKSSSKESFSNGLRKNSLVLKGSNEKALRPSEEAATSTKKYRCGQSGVNNLSPLHYEEKGSQVPLHNEESGRSRKRAFEAPLSNGNSLSTRSFKKFRESRISSEILTPQFSGPGDTEDSAQYDFTDEYREDNENFEPKESQALEVPPLQALPSCSTDLPIPNQSVADLFEAFTFLRSFSWVLFLSPFVLKDFVASVVLREANVMIDSIHVSLLRLLHRQLERLATDGCKMATIILRHRDWNLLDSVTWPCFLVAFLLTYGFGQEYAKTLLLLGLGKTEYYGLETPTKLAILSFLCQKALETEEIRAEIATRADLEGEVEFDDSNLHTPKPNMWANWRALNDCSVKQRISFDTDSQQANFKLPGSRTKELLKGSYDSQGSADIEIRNLNDHGNGHKRIEARLKDSKDMTLASRSLQQQPDAADWNSDECVLCGMDGNLICCDGCPAAYHSRCVGLSKLSLPDGDWYCPECVIEQQENLQLRKSLRGAQFLGMDPHGRVYTAACGYLLVSETSGDNCMQSYCYAYQDFSSILEFLSSSGPLFKDILQGIRKIWRVPDDFLEKPMLAQKNELGDANPHPDVSDGPLKEMQEFPSLISSISRSLPCGEMAAQPETEILELKSLPLMPLQLGNFGPDSLIAAASDTVLVQVLGKNACCKTNTITDDENPEEVLIPPGESILEKTPQVVNIDKPDAISQLKPVAEEAENVDAELNRVFLERLEDPDVKVTVPDTFERKGLSGSPTQTLVAIEQVDIAVSEGRERRSSSDDGIIAGIVAKTNEQADKHLTLGVLSASHSVSVKSEKELNKSIPLLDQSAEDSRTNMNNKWRDHIVCGHNPFQPGQLETCLLQPKLPAIEARVKGEPNDLRQEEPAADCIPSAPLRVLHCNGILLAREDVESPHLGPVLQKVTRITGRSQLQEHCLEDERCLNASQFVNRYVLGDAAAAAAASFITASAGEKQHFESLGSQKKAWTALQLKAFSQAPVTFYWPSNKKKLMETPKERCGWCFSCQNSNKKTCFLNQVAKKLSAGAALVLGGIRSIKKGHDHLPIVTSYILYMEENLHGLLVGPWEKEEQRRRWRKRVEQAGSIRDIRASLLEMGCSLRRIAFRTDWSEVAEDAPELIPSSVVAATLSGVPVKKGPGTPGVPGKKGPGGKHGRTEMSYPQKGTVSFGGSAWGIQWWKGGKLARKVFDWEALACETIRKASRQGGLKEIPGLVYSEGSGCPRRTKLSAWRARVESVHSISELALQIRYLDAQIRWHELSMPERKSNAEILEAGSESTSIKKPSIIAKTVRGNVYMYLMDSEGKHPGATKGSKLKNIRSPSKLNPLWTLSSGPSLKDLTQRGEYVWLSEEEVPLYQLKVFEEQLRNICPSKALKFVGGRKGKRSNLKLSKTDRFKILLDKHVPLDEKKESSIWKCASCKSGIYARQLVQCQKCSGSFHKRCVEASSQGDVFMCNGCSIPTKNRHGRKFKSLSQDANSGSSKVSQSNRKRKVARLEEFELVSEIQKDQGSTNLISSQLIPVQRKKRTKQLYVQKNGVLWMKSKPEVDLSIFKQDKIVLAGGSGRDSLRGPICCLCSQPYNLNLMYIGCEYCKEWFHADAVGVSEDKLPMVAGFKCYKCRKKGPPKCSYSNGQDHTYSYSLSSEVISGQAKDATLDANGPIYSNDQEQPIGSNDPEPCTESVASGCEPLSQVTLATNASEKQLFGGNDPHCIGSVASEIGYEPCTKSVVAASRYKHLLNLTVATTADEKQAFGNNNPQPCTESVASESGYKLTPVLPVNFSIPEKGLNNCCEANTEVSLTAINLAKPCSTVHSAKVDWAGRPDEIFILGTTESVSQSLSACDQLELKSGNCDTYEDQITQSHVETEVSTCALPQLPCRGPLSFLELLSCEDDMVEDVPFPEMDFTLSWPSDIHINEHLSTDIPVNEHELTTVPVDSGNFLPGISMSQGVSESMDMF